MRILVVSESERKMSNTMNWGKMAENNMKRIDETINFEYCFLIEKDFQLCLGCSTCQKQLGKKCSLKNKVQEILESLNNTDGIFFASPGNTSRVSGLFKNWIDSLLNLDQIPKKSIENKRSSSLLKIQEIPKWRLLLLDYMKRNKPYLDPELTLPQLAEEIGMSRNQLSYLMNECLGMNFYEFINTYRIDQVKKWLGEASKDQLTILGLALEAGFNSKVTFNTAFKKYTGLTPSQYKKDVRKKL